MATAAGYFDRKLSTATRPGLSHLQPNPSSPHTPLRTFSSAFNSPSLSYRAPEEESLVFEFGNRHFSAGFLNESAPRCRLGFGPEESRRVGDYRKWMPGYGERKRKRQRADGWGNEYELWRMDVRGLDMGLVGDKIERAVREAVTKHLLVDVKAKKLVVVLPTLIPHPLLSTVLATLFKIFQNPGVTLLSAPVLSTVVAGLRSALVVDIGWRETIVTGIYEYREVQEKRTTRAMRMVTLEMARLLERQDTEPKKDERKPADAAKEEADDGVVTVDLEQAEEVTRRMAWCRSRSEPNSASQTSQVLPARLASIAEDEIEDQAISSNLKESTLVPIPSPSSPRLSIQIPFSAFASPVEIALLGKSLQRHELDDDDQPLHKLIYRSLLSLPADVRAVCMSRIIFTGGGSNIPGLKARLLDEVTALVKARGWDPVDGKLADQRRRFREISGNAPTVKVKDVETKKPTDITDQQTSENKTASPASLAPQLSDPIEEKIRREQDKGMKPTVSGVIRGVESLGAWAGASLLASLRIKGVVEIERDAFQQHGLAGARKDAEASAAPQKGMPRPSMGGQSGWTLGPWA